MELCWYIAPDFRAFRLTSPKWLAPSWSWASTRQGTVKNAVSGGASSTSFAHKARDTDSVGTAFDMPYRCKHDARPTDRWRSQKKTPRQRLGKTSLLHGPSSDCTVQLPTRGHNHHRDFELGRCLSCEHFLSISYHKSDYSVMLALVILNNRIILFNMNYIAS
jgi:hypothetical protein